MIRRWLFIRRPVRTLAEARTRLRALMADTQPPRYRPEWSKPDDRFNAMQQPTSPRFDVVRW